jgi:hypothetical protein
MTASDGFNEHLRSMLASSPGTGGPRMAEMLFTIMPRREWVNIRVYLE